jgi:orotate phosphoribosyltransferase
MGLFKDSKCQLLSLLTYDELLEVTMEKEYIRDDLLEMLKEWRNSPFEWGEKYGFPKDAGK